MCQFDQRESEGAAVAEESWHEARLIPTSGINGAEEQERRATSALLAVLSAVKEFGRSFTQPFGAPSGPLSCYIEVPFLLGDKRVYPDGLIRIKRGSKSWSALVEVKTGSNRLETEQLENYLDVARAEGFDALITISNEIPAIAGTHPTKVDKRKLRSVSLHHVSWSQVLSEAVLQKEFRGVADPDQAWILGELIRYLEHQKSGALEFDDMSDSWVSVRDAVTTGTLRATDKGIAEVAARFDALLRFTGLQLGRQLGRQVSPVLSRKELADPTLRSRALTDILCKDGVLTATLRIPDTAGDLVVTADLRSSQLTCHVDVDAPREGRPTTRVNWLTRQLKNAPSNVRIEAFVNHSRGASTAELINTVRDNPACLIADPTRELRNFRVAMTMPLGAKRGRGRGAFIDSVLNGVDAFYSDVLQDLRPWSATPPKLRPAHPGAPDIDESVPASLSSTDYSSQDDVAHWSPPTAHAAESAPLTGPELAVEAEEETDRDEPTGDVNQEQSPEPGHETSRESQQPWITTPPSFEDESTPSPDGTTQPA